MWALIKVTIPTKEIECVRFCEAEHTVGALLSFRQCEWVADFCAGPDQGRMWFTGKEPPCFVERCPDCPVTVVEHDAT